MEEDNQNDPKEADRSIMREEFDKALSELKNKIAPGVDQIPAEVLKNYGENTKKIIYELIKKVMKLDKYQEILQSA